METGRLEFEKRFWLSNSTSVLKNGQRYLLANRNDKRVFLSSEVYGILDEAIEKGWSVQKLLDIFDTKEDREYLLDVLDKLLGAGIIQQKEDSEQYEYETASLILTDRCNLTCIHCCQNANAKSNTAELKTEEWLHIIDKIKQMNIESVTVTGGETLIREDMERISRHLRTNYSGHLILITNGTLINSRNVKYLIEVYNHISISMDGCNEELTGFIRGKGVYKKVIEAINLLHGEGYKSISLSAILPNSLDVEKEFEVLCEKLGVKPEIRCISKKGRGGDNYALMQEKFSEYIKRNKYQEYVFEESETAANLNACSAVKGTNLTIGPSGWVYPCNLLQSDMYKQGTIDEIVENKELFKLAQFKGTICEHCCVNVFCWSCMSDYDVMRDDEKQLFERCRLKKGNLMKWIWGEENADNGVDNSTVQPEM